MTQYLPVMIISFAAAFLLTPLSRWLARRLGMVNAPRQDRFSMSATPLLGGLAIYSGMVLALVLASPGNYWIDNLLEGIAIVGGASFMALVGLLDDRYNLKPWQKFGAQFAAGLAVALAGVRIDVTNIDLINIALTMFWVVALTNALNFLDNMDGLTAGVTAIACGFFFIFAAGEGQDLIASLAAALGGAALGFLIFNFNPASIYMGDMGSLVVGFMLSVLAILLRFEAPLTVATWSVPLLVLAVPLFDISLVTFTRLREGRPPWVGGKDHSSHRLAQAGLGARRAVLALYGIELAGGVAALIINSSTPETALALLGLALLVALLSFAALEWFYIRRARAARLRAATLQPEQPTHKDRQAS